MGFGIDDDCYVDGMIIVYFFWVCFVFILWFDEIYYFNISDGCLIFVYEGKFICFNFDFEYLSWVFQGYWL